MRVVVVEDFKVMREILVAMLEQLGHEIVAVSDSMAQAIFVDAELIICEQALASDYFRDAQVEPPPDGEAKAQVLLMGYDSERAQMQELMSQVVNGFIVKPFTLKGLDEKIKRLTLSRCAS